jgi:ubiquinone/menaquinone biosynthesis C-methylase UbiE
MLLDHIGIRPNMTVLDIGFGTGFPILELAQRLGKDSTVYGIDIWKEGLNRSQFKGDRYELSNIRLIEGNAENTEFPDNMFDLIVSNVGINNFEHPGTVLEECFRICKPEGSIALTTNPVGHMSEFYDVYAMVLQQLELHQYIPALEKHQDHRLSLERIGHLMQRAGFRLRSTHQRMFMMRFVDAGAFFNHALIGIGFVDAWKEIVPDNLHERVFREIHRSIDKIAGRDGEFRVTIPCLYIEAGKVSL